MPTDDNRPKILLITRNLPPLVGGMERLLQNLALGANEYANVTVIGPQGSTEHLPDDIRVYEVPTKLTLFLPLSTVRALRLMPSEHFDAVIGGNGLIAPTLSILSTLFGCKTLIFLHGLDLLVDNSIYQAIFVPCIRRVDTVMTNSSFTRQVALDKGVPESRISTINPGTDMPEIPGSDELEDFRSRHDIGFNKIMIFVGRMTRRKGLSRFIKDSLPIILAEQPDTGLLVIGDNPNDSLNQLGEQREVLAAAEKLLAKDRIMFLGQVSDSDLLSCYAIADVQVFPLIEVPGDIEGFGMIAIEAAACGTPTVAFELGGVGDAVSADNGHLVPPEHYALFAQRVLGVLESHQPTRENCLSHARRFSWNHFNEKVRKLVPQAGETSNQNT